MSIPKTLILDISKSKVLVLDISKDPHVITTDISTFDEDAVDSILNDKLNDYVKVANIVDDLETDSADKVLSAAQGKQLKSVIDKLEADVTRMVETGAGISEGAGIKVTVENSTAVININVKEDSPLKINENNELYLEWNENV